MGRYFDVEFDEDFIRELKDTLAYMVNPVTIDVFIDDPSRCETCEDAYKLMKTIADASPVRQGKKMIELRVFSRSRPEDLEEFKRQNVERVPTVAMLGGVIRYTGTPAGEEVRGLIETIMRISENESGLEPETKKSLANLKRAVHIEVVVTPSCPYCPYAALLANMFAYEAWKQSNPKVIADTVEAYENMDIAEKYGVMSVPAIALNGIMSFIGVPYEEDFINYVVAAAEGRIEELVLKTEGETSGL
ncbi:MAG: thioredoxin family protein [Acidilobus sp.]|nr:thioredoxin family protein [Acidilobus sp.]